MSQLQSDVQIHRENQFGTGGIMRGTSRGVNDRKSQRSSSTFLVYGAWNNNVVDFVWRIFDFRFSIFDWKQ